jgi:alpha-L-rhamnosidase
MMVQKIELNEYKTDLMKKNIFLILLFFTSSVMAIQPSPSELKVNYLSNPLGIDVIPCFSWEQSSLDRNTIQTAYQIIVSTDLKSLEIDKGTNWNSEKVTSGETLQITYKGTPLQSGTRYYWKVRIWDGKDNVSSYSEINWFETGLLIESDWKGDWIGDGKLPPQKPEDFYKTIPAPLFRKNFEVKKDVINARLYICGLGYNEVYLNGKKTNDLLLEPGWTQFAKTVFYNVNDITEQLSIGENTLGVMLGNGWYNPLPMNMFGQNLREVLTIGQPKLRCQLRIDYKDGTSEIIVSDETWKSAEGPIVRNNIYLGEWYDARLELPGWSTTAYDDSKWTNAKKTEGPAGKLTWQYIPPIRHTRTLFPSSIWSPESNVFIYDMGQNFAGVIRFFCKAPAGTEIVFRYAEILKSDRNIEVNTSVAAQIKGPGRGGPGAPDIAWQEDRYVCNGKGIETFEPRFTFHGFRFVEVKGLPYTPALNDIQGLAMNSDVKDVSEFSCSNGLFNKIQQITEWSMLSNIFSVESDCPAREKYGYGGDMVTVSEAFMNNYDMSSFYQKAIRDFANDALGSGAMTEVAPNIGINENGIEPGTGPVGWTLAYPFLLYQMYKYYGNIDIVKEQYPILKHLVDFYNERTPGFLILDCIGDHNSVDLRPTPVSAASAWYHHVKIITELAKILGKDEDVKKYLELSENIKKAFIEKFVNNETGVVYTGTEGSQVFALYYDLLPPGLKRKVFNQLIDQILTVNKGHMTTGIFSTKMMLNWLSEQNRDDLSFLMLSQKEYPGYGYMIANNATTLWENWGIKIHESQNHPMFGSVSEWFYKSVLGIQQTDGSVAYNDIIIKPSVIGDLTWAKGSYHSVRGNICSSWWKFGNDFHLEITIPANTKGTVYLPLFENALPDIYEGNFALVEKGVINNSGQFVKMIKLTNQFAILNVGSGKYHFIVK